jgi:hypothetical protein
MYIDKQSPDESLLSILRSANKTGRFWIGASDFEEKKKFKWYYSGKPVSESNWLEEGGRPKLSSSKDDDESCLQVRHHPVIYIFQDVKRKTNFWTKFYSRILDKVHTMLGTIMYL